MMSFFVFFLRLLFNKRYWQNWIATCSRTILGPYCPFVQKAVQTGSKTLI